MSVSLEQVVSMVERLTHAQKEMMTELRQLREEVKRVAHDEEVDKADTHHLVPLMEDTHYEVKRLHVAVENLHYQMQRELHATQRNEELE